MNDHRVPRRLLATAAAAALLLAGCSSAGSDGAGAEDPTTTAAPDGASTTAGPEAPEEATTTVAPSDDGAEVADVGTYAVGSTVLDLADPSRGTAANGDAPAADERALPTYVTYPAVGEGDGPDGELAATDGAAFLDGRFPLVIFSHGVTGRGEEYGGNTRAWASAGYIVIAPDYPLSNRNAPGGPTVTDVLNQPADASFLLDVFTDPDGPAAEVVAHVDEERLAAVGHSLGAITTLNLAYGCCVDERLDAAVSWAGAPVGLPQEAAEGAAEGPPLLVVHGTEDGTLGYALGEAIFEQVGAPRWFVTLPGEGHVPAYVAGTSGPTSNLVVTTTLDFLDAELKDDATGIERMEQAVADAGPDVATIESAGT